jgi:hypothetical protein
MSARQTSILIALEAALMTAFTTDTALCALVRGRIHDGSPRGAVLPYLAFAEASCGDFSSGDGAGAAVALTIEAVADDGDRERALRILDAALERALAVDATPGVGALVLIAADDTRIDRTKDGRAWRASSVLKTLVDG